MNMESKPSRKLELKLWQNKTNKEIDPDLFSARADELARVIYREGKDQEKKQLNKPTQIRKFYDEVLRFDSLIKTKTNFSELLPYLKMLNAKAAYALGRNLISQGFKEFISTSLDQIKDKEDFNVFVSLFEAFMGYYKFYYEKEGEQIAQGGRI